jgi:hypothetical protein
LNTGKPRPARAAVNDTAPAGGGLPICYAALINVETPPISYKLAKRNISNIYPFNLYIASDGRYIQRPRPRRIIGHCIGKQAAIP